MDRKYLQNATAYKNNQLVNDRVQTWKSWNSVKSLERHINKTCSITKLSSAFPTLCSLSLTQANTTPPKLSREEGKGRGALLSDICKGTKLRKVAVVNDRSAPLLESKSQTPTTEHPYIRLYQYLNQQQKQPKQPAAPAEEQKKPTADYSALVSLESKSTAPSQR